MELRRIKKLLPFTVIFRWVQSHQNDGIPSELLSDASRLNVQVDRMAGEISHNMSSHVPTLRIPSGVIAIGVGGVLHHHFPQKVIWMHIHERALRSSIMSRTGWPDGDFDSIDWENWSPENALPPQQHYVVASFQLRLHRRRNAFLHLVGWHRGCYQKRTHAHSQHHPNRSLHLPKPPKSPY